MSMYNTHTRLLFVYILNLIFKKKIIIITMENKYEYVLNFNAIISISATIGPYVWEVTEGARQRS